MRVRVPAYSEQASSARGVEVLFAAPLSKVQMRRLRKALRALGPRGGPKVQLDAQRRVARVSAKQWPRIKACLRPLRVPVDISAGGADRYVPSKRELRALVLGTLTEIGVSAQALTGIRASVGPFAMDVELRLRASDKAEFEAGDAAAYAPVAAQDGIGHDSYVAYKISSAFDGVDVSFAWGE